VILIEERSEQGTEDFHLVQYEGQNERFVLKTNPRNSFVELIFLEL